MKAVRFHEYGGPDVLRIDEVDAPEPAAGQVRIAVRAAGVNPLDWRIRTGQMRDFMPRPLPAGVGVEAAGVVDALGEGVTGVAIGDTVFGRGTDTVADQAVLTAWAPMPDGLSFEEAAGLATPFETAVRAIEAVGAVAGDTLLLTAAAGGVGTAVMQVARDAGIRVIGTASAPKHDYVKQFGAIPVTYGPGLADRVRVLAPDGIDGAIDLLGDGAVVELAAITGDPARVVTLVDVTATQHGAKASFQPLPDLPAVLEDAARRYAAGRFRMPIQQRFAMENAADAQVLSQHGHVTGRLVITIDQV